MSLLAYKPNVEETLNRLRALVERRALDQIFAAIVMPSKAMSEFQRKYTGGFVSEYPEQRSEQATQLHTKGSSFGTVY